MKKLLLVTVLAGLTAGSVLAQAPVPPAQAPGQGAPPMAPPMRLMVPCTLQALRVPPVQLIARIQDELKLSDDQKAKVKAAMDKYVEKVRPLTEQSRDVERALLESLNATTFDTQKAKDAAAKSLKLEEGMANASIDFWAAFKGTLTPEQNAQFAQMMPRGPRPGFGPGPGMPPAPGQAPAQFPAPPPPAPGK